MAICRFGDDSDVYVFGLEGGDWDCCGCALRKRADFIALTAAAMIEHLEQHRAAGHKVPDDAFEELASEVKL